MPTHRPWTDQDDQTLIDLHATGMSLIRCAKEMGRSPSAASKHGKQLGLDWDRTRTAKATEAVKIDAAARRASLEERYLIEADRILDQLWEPCDIHSFGGKDNTYAKKRVAKPPFRDQRDIIMASSTAAGAANKLRDMTVEGEASAVDQWTASMLGRPAPTAADSPEFLST